VCRCQVYFLALLGVNQLHYEQMHGRLKMIFLSVLATLSLGMASVSACPCSHHVGANRTAVSCHGHTDMPDMDGGHERPRADTGDCIDNDGDCICAETASRTFARSFTPHLQQFVAVHTPVVVEIAQPTTVRVVTPRIDFERPFYLTDSFYNLSPKRGPPVL
jgi:hypothetical protein